MSLPDKNVHIYKKVKRKIERKIKYIYREKKGKYGFRHYSRLYFRILLFN